MPPDGFEAISVPEDTYAKLQEERRERGNPRWGVFFEQLLADEDTPVLDVPEDPAAWRRGRHDVDEDGSVDADALRSDIASIEERVGRIEQMVEELGRSR